MQLIGFIILACLTLAVLRAVLVIMVLACVVTLLLGLCFRPRETVGTVIVMSAMSMLQSYPLTTATVLASLFAIYFRSLKKPLDDADSVGLKGDIW